LLHRLATLQGWQAGAKAWQPALWTMLEKQRAEVFSEALRSKAAASSPQPAAAARAAGSTG
jgi:hypothetical protein